MADPSRKAEKQQGKASWFKCHTFRQGTGELAGHGVLGHGVRVVGHFPGPRYVLCQTQHLWRKHRHPSRGQLPIQQPLGDAETGSEQSLRGQGHTQGSSLKTTPHHSDQLTLCLRCRNDFEQPEGRRLTPAELGSQAPLSPHTPSPPLLINEADKEGLGGSSQPCPSCSPPQASYYLYQAHFYVNALTIPFRGTMPPRLSP